MTERINEQQISALMKESMLELPPEFDSMVMAKILEQSIRKKQLYTYLKLSCAFLILGIVLGVFINIYITTSDVILTGLSSDDFLLTFQILFVGISLIQIDAVFQLISRWRSR